MYEFATGLIRVLEKKIPDKTDIERMILAKNAQDAFVVLNDTDYADNLLNRGPADYLDVLNDDFQQLKALLDKSIGNTLLFNFLFIDFDALNVKALLKKKMLGSQDLKALNNFGLYSPKAIEKYINAKFKLIKHSTAHKKVTNIELASKKIQARIHKSFNSIKKIDFNKEIKEKVKKIIYQLINKKKVTARVIDTTVDHQLWQFKLRLAQKMKNQFIKDLIQTQIDFLNTKMLLRLITEKEDKEFKINQKSFLAGGRMTPEQLMHFYAADQPVLFNNLKEISEWYELSEIFDAFIEKQNLWELEKELDRYTLNYILKQARISAYGPAVIAGYFYAKVNAIRNIRIIMSGKLNGIKTDIIQKRVIL